MIVNVTCTCVYLERLCNSHNAVHVVTVVTQHVFSCISRQILFGKSHLEAKGKLVYTQQILELAGSAIVRALV